MGGFSTLDEVRGGYDKSPVTADLRSESAPDRDDLDLNQTPETVSLLDVLINCLPTTITSMLFKDGSVASRKYQ